MSVLPSYDVTVAVSSWLKDMSSAVAAKAEKVEILLIGVLAGNVGFGTMTKFQTKNFTETSFNST